MDLRMVHRNFTHKQWILTAIILIGGTSSNITFLVTKHPIINETMYETYSSLYTLDMSNQTGFEFPIDKVMLIHNGLSRYHCNNCGVHSIYRVSLSKLPQLSHLMLKNNTLRYIHPDAFECNTWLEKVNLAGNQLSTFNPEATIRHISSLSMLDLSWNEQFDLNRVDLQGTRLMFFTCNHCHTTILNRTTLTSMPKLSQLYLSYNGMERIDDAALVQAKYIQILNVDGNRNLQRLNLKSESIKKLSAKECSLRGTLNTSKMPMLEFINVRNNNIISLDEHGFMQNTVLNDVLLDDNLIEKVPNFLLDLPLNGLWKLCLDRNPLQPDLQVDAAKDLYTAKKLRNSCLDDANHLHKFENYLPNINGKAVYKKSPIHYLSSDGLTVDLSNRNIVYIEQEYLVDNENVKKVLFDDNHSFDFQQNRVFLKSSSIEGLSLKNCSITTIYEATFKELHNLKYLHLQGNKIQFIRSDSLFKNNPSISFISLANNKLDFIAALAFQKLEKLEILQLDRNERLSNKANDSFLLSKSLRKLSCRHCRFEWLDAMTLVGLPNLLELNLEHNNIAILDANSLQRTTQLKYLNLHHNHLLAFEPNIYQLSQLKTLCLGGSPNFDLEHPKNQVLVDNIQKMMQLDKGCSDNTFSKELDKRYNKDENETKLHPKIEHASLINFETSSAGFRADMAIPLLLCFVVFLLF
ncbi:toll-like receptor 6 isoform X1 [Ochlerotatus camptorhynchus]|uniref:toll-like receptor 6 isoform X1 n=2 Tax=Ochlerotatus camptorhynchus TaxID=644619 RepID=UPI0031DC3293